MALLSVLSIHSDLHKSAPTIERSQPVGAVYDRPTQMNSFRQVDQHDIGIVAKAVEHDLLSIGTDVEGAHDRRLVETCELTGFECGQVQHPEILQCPRSLHVNQTLAIRQELQAFAARWKLNGR